MNTVLHEQLASDAGIKRAQVQCEKCKRILLVDGAKCLAEGWPQCHGYTMTLLRPHFKKGARRK